MASVAWRATQVANNNPVVNTTTNKYLHSQINTNYNSNYHLSDQVAQIFNKPNFFNLSQSPPPQLNLQHKSSNEFLHSYPFASIDSNDYTSNHVNSASHFENANKNNLINENEHTNRSSSIANLRTKALEHSLALGSGLR
jgi:hypothetical protein